MILRIFQETFNRYEIDLSPGDTLSELASAQNTSAKGQLLESNGVDLRPMLVELS